MLQLITFILSPSTLNLSDTLLYTNLSTYCDETSEGRSLQPRTHNTLQTESIFQFEYLAFVKCLLSYLERNTGKNRVQ